MQDRERCLVEASIHGQNLLNGMCSLPDVLQLCDTIGVSVLVVSFQYFTFTVDTTSHLPNGNFFLRVRVGIKNEPFTIYDAFSLSMARGRVPPREAYMLHSLGFSLSLVLCVGLLLWPTELQRLRGFSAPTAEPAFGSPSWSGGRSCPGTPVRPYLSGPEASADVRCGLPPVLLLMTCWVSSFFFFFFFFFFCDPARCVLVRKCMHGVLPDWRRH